MINATKDQLLFLQTGEALAVLARQAAGDALAAIEPSAWARPNAIGGDNSRSFSSIIGLFCERLRHRVLAKDGPVLDEAYFNRILSISLSSSLTPITVKDYEALMGVREEGRIGFQKNWGRALRSCLSYWLLALHQRRGVVLPFAFQVPYSLSEKSGGGRVEVGAPFYGELLALMRDAGTGDPDPAFASYTQSQKGLLLSYGSKTILALGWVTAEDARLDDLLRLREAYLKSRFTGSSSPPPWALLSDALERKFGARSAVSKRVLEEALRPGRGPSEEARSRSKASIEQRRRKRHAALEESLALSAQKSPEDRLLDLMRARDTGSRFDPRPALQAKRFAKAPNVDFSEAKSWIELEGAYLAKIRRESYGPLAGALGYLNAYLFGYLLDWMAARPDFPRAFPRTPAGLVGSAFVSRLLIADKSAETPLTLAEFLGKLQEVKGWSQETLYAHLKHIEGFFGFLERYADELPGCAGFKQSISAHDYPRVRRSPGTVKGLIPRSAFGFLLAYMESLAAFSEAVLQKALRDPLDPDFFLLAGSGARGDRRKETLDTVADFDRFGFMPFLRWKGKAVPMRRIPNVLECARFILRDDPLTPGQPRLIPRPHLIHQLIVALQTGLRGNHIQWLDSETFDVHAKKGEAFTKLWVNTDKSKSSGWTPFVSEGVMETLRAQKTWRDRIDAPGFQERIFYNNNERSKWGSFLPLFSWTEDGRPHLDKHYAEAWKKIVFGAQSLMIELGVDCPLLARLAPVGVAFDDAEAPAKLKAIGSKSAAYTPLVICSSVTPHSARVSVVSHYITALPADLIGKYITGQTPSVVSHYVKLDSGALAREAQHQGLEAARTAQERAFNDLISGRPGEYIQADGAGSRLAKSLGVSVEQTIAAYGCVSVGGGEGATLGVDVLRDSIGRNAAFNKTEICPHGNHCPPEIIQELKGARRCGLCPRAVRSIDHLPAVVARGKQAYEELAALGEAMDAGAKSMSDSDLEAIEAQRQQLSEELVGWLVAQEVLESARARCEEEAGAQRWVVQTPEILEKELRLVRAPTDATRYTLSRLAECQAYPNLQSPMIRARFDILRRQLSARLGDFKAAFDQAVPGNPAGECAGLLRSLVEAHGLSFDQVAGLLQTNEHLAPKSLDMAPKLLGLDTGDTP